MIGKTIKIEVTGAIFDAGRADVWPSLLDESANLEPLWARFDVQSQDPQLSDIKGRGKLAHHNGSAPLKYSFE